MTGKLASDQISQEECFRLTMCKGCPYRSRDGKHCELPCAKDCALQDWEWARGHAVLYVTTLALNGSR